MEERIKLTIIRSLGKRWLQFKKSCGLSSPASFTFSTNCASFALLLHFAAAPLLRSSSNIGRTYFKMPTSFLLCFFMSHYISHKQPKTELNHWIPEASVKLIIACRNMESDLQFVFCCWCVF